MVKDAAVWLFFTGVLVTGDLITSPEDNSVFKKVFKDSIKAIILAEFMVNFFTMPLILELIFVPFITVIAVTKAVASQDDKLKDVELLFDVILGLCGIGLLGYSIWKAYTGFDTLDLWDTFRQFIFPFAMSLMFSPMVFLIVLYSVYDLIFTGLEIGPDKSKEVKRYAKWRLFSFFGLRLNKLREFKRSHFTDMFRVQTIADVDYLLNEYLTPD
ncbi:hypothetical protein [Gimesia sp.]|uniref:hypothetical protein n=1 Tax=Gimesia sp. TaxID=2024833 RepID=UPI003A92C0AE